MPQAKTTMKVGLVADRFLLLSCLWGADPEVNLRLFCWTARLLCCKQHENENTGVVASTCVVEARCTTSIYCRILSCLFLLHRKVSGSTVIHKTIAYVRIFCELFFSPGYNDRHITNSRHVPLFPHGGNASIIIAKRIS